MKDSIVLVSCCILIIFIGLIGMVKQHEQAHYEFFRYYGVQSEIHLNWFGLMGGYTEPNATDLNQLSEQDNRVLTMLHSINEIYWYPFLMMYMIVSFFFILCLTFFLKSWKEMKELKNN
jgi:predicted PurR-regulated permease PerM